MSGPPGRRRSHRCEPAVMVSKLTTLNGHQLLAQLTRNRADFTGADLVLAVPIYENAHAREHGPGTRQGRFPVTYPFQHFGDIKHPFLDPVAAVTRERQNRVTGDAMEEG